MVDHGCHGCSVRKRKESQDDHGGVTLSYFYGATCPEAVECKSYKVKMNRCRSYVCREFSMNYLARHLTNAHGLTNRVAAFNAASKHRQLEEDVPRSERDAYRGHTETQQERKKELERGKQQQSPKRQPPRTPEVAASSTAKKPQRQPRTPEVAESSTAKRRRVDDTAEQVKANADVVDYLKAKVPQIRRYAAQARRFAETADDFAGICDVVAGVIARATT